MKLRTTYSEVVGTVLARLRRRAGLVQGEVALRAGVSVPTWSRIEAGQLSPRVEQVALAAAILETPMSEVFRHTDEVCELLRKNGVLVMEQAAEPKILGVGEAWCSKTVLAGYVRRVVR